MSHTNEELFGRSIIPPWEPCRVYQVGDCVFTTTAVEPEDWPKTYTAWARYVGQRESDFELLQAFLGACYHTYRLNNRGEG